MPPTTRVNLQSPYPVLIPKILGQETHSIAYVLSDSAAPGLDLKDLRITNFVANCVAGAVHGAMEAFFENFFAQ